MTDICGRRGLSKLISSADTPRLHVSTSIQNLSFPGFPGFPGEDSSTVGVVIELSSDISLKQFSQARSHMRSFKSRLSSQVVFDMRTGTRATKVVSRKHEIIS